MSSGLPTLGRSVSERVCSFRRIILGSRARVEAAYKERAEHIFTVKIHGRGSLRGARRYRVGFTVYSFNLFNRPVDVDANGGSEKNAGNSIRSREERELGNESNVNEFSSGYVYSFKRFHHPCLSGTCHLPSSEPPLFPLSLANLSDVCVLVLGSYCLFHAKIDSLVYTRLFVPLCLCKFFSI